MKQQNVQINLKTGLQARPAALFVQEATRYQSDVFIEKDGKKVNAKSIMGLMSLALGTGTTFTLITDGNDEEAALQSLASFVEESN